MNFPYTGWVLLPSFKPAECTFDEPSIFIDGWHKTEKGNIYSTKDIYASKQAAIDAGSIDLDRQQSALDKKQANINKRRAELGKAQKSL